MHVSKLIVGLVVASFSIASFALDMGQSNHRFGKKAAAVKSKMNANKDNKDNKDKNGKKGKKN